MNHGVKIEAGNDVVMFLKSQHEQVKRLFERMIASRGDARRQDRSSFPCEGCSPSMRPPRKRSSTRPPASPCPDRDRVVSARLAEARAAKRALAELEGLEVDSPAFDAATRKLQARVLAHAESEEREEVARLGAHLDAPKLARIRKAAEIAEMMAPPHPHPGVESAPANLLTGPFASIMDRTRDALASKA